jgi:hypothetical protein
METQQKYNKRTRSSGTPEIAALKKEVSIAVRAAWHAEAARARREKALRQRDTVERRVAAQRAALERVRAAVDAALGAITPTPGITPDPTPVLTPGTLAATFAGSAAPTTEQPACG